MSEFGKYRIGKKVFHTRKDIWLQCKEYYVTDTDVNREYNRFLSLGINVTQDVAVAAALREKKRVFDGGFRIKW